MQYFVGDLPVELFRFPLNVIIMALWGVALAWLYRNRSSSAIAASLLSMRATTLALGLMIALGIIFGLELSPQTTAWPAVVAILFILTHLALVTLREARATDGRLRPRFILNHAGLLLALGAGFWGAPDRVELRAVVERDKPTNVAFTQSHSTTLLDYDMQLDDFRIEYFASGAPSLFEADVRIDQKSVTLRVNHPYNRTPSETVYLLSYDSERPNDARYCIVEIVREPWRWLSVAGIALLAAGAVLMFVQGKPKR